MRRFRLAMAQINTTVGDLEGNTSKIMHYIDEAKALGADLVSFPELAITGYPPEDLLFKPQFISDNLHKLDEIVAHAKDISAVVGFVDRQGDIHNAAAVIHDGRLVGIYHKCYLPNYGVFDEDRYFQAGSDGPVFVINGVKIGVNICEDIWHAAGPMVAQRDAGAEVIVNINSSPYHQGKKAFREKMIATRASDNGLIISYTNLVGGQDELVFDGNSMVFNQRGELITQGSQFQEELIVVDLDAEDVFRYRLHDPRLRKERGHVRLGEMEAKVIMVSERGPRTSRPPLPERRPIIYGFPGEVYAALVLGTRDYVSKNGFKKVLIGLSGGIDSTIVAVIAADALGPENVVGVSMPSRYSSEGSITDAQILAKGLGIRLLTIPIEEAFKASLHTLSEAFKGAEPNVAEENLQARIRANIIMSLSNKFGWLVLTTGNKSEMATGYCTLFGDMAGGFAVIKDVPKTLVYKLAQYRNTLKPKDVIPRSVIEKEPTAELKPNQRDVDTLPPYPVLDPILKAYVEEDRNFEQIVDMGFDEETVKRVILMVDRNEYKRRQSPPGIKITQRAFGRDRRLPIVNRYWGF
ncbi:MAG: NAD+ synthase [Chloroflexi bacterium]|nr:NAD+ synthase [Chloroflexota bacterium]